MGIGVPYLLNELILVSWFHKEHKFYCRIIMSSTDVGIRFLILEHNSNNLLIITDEAKQIIHEMDKHDSDYVMTYTTAITSIPNTLKEFWIQ